MGDEHPGLKQPLFAAPECDEDEGVRDVHTDAECVVSGVDLSAEHTACAWQPVLGLSALVGIADMIKLLDANIVPAYHSDDERPFER